MHSLHGGRTGSPGLRRNDQHEAAWHSRPIDRPTDGNINGNIKILRNETLRLETDRKNVTKSILHPGIVVDC